MNEFVNIYRRMFIAGVVLLVFGILVWSAAIRSMRLSGEASLYFLDVGQGDSSLIVLPGSVQILVDGGPPNRKLLTELHEVLGKEDRYIDLVIMTHPQLDHYGGFIEVFEQYEVGAFIASGRLGDTESYRTLQDAIQKKRIPYITVRAGDSIRYGASVLDFLAPSPEELVSDELNDTSLVFRLEADGLTVLYTGDIGDRVEKRLAVEEGIVSSVLKVPHHGSRFSSGAQFLKAVDPQVAVIEVGKNSYGHPTPAVMKRLENAGATVFRTDRNGTVKIESDGVKMQVSTDKNGAN